MPVGHSSFRLQSKWFFAAIAALIVIFAAEMFFSARRESQTFDEPAHLYAGYSYWLHGDFGINPEHPPLVKLVASLPLLIERPSYPKPLNVFFRGASVLGGRQLFSTPDAQSLLAHSRIAVSGLPTVRSLAQTSAPPASSSARFTPSIATSSSLRSSDSRCAQSLQA